MLILDTDILTIIQLRRGTLYQRVVARLEKYGDDVCVSVISFEEQLRGWLALIAKSRQTEQQLVAYHRLMELLDDFRHRTILPFESDSAHLFDNLRTTHRRRGAMDLKIAAVALAKNATLATRNVSDFQGIEGLAVLDPTDGK